MTDFPRTPSEVPARSSLGIASYADLVKHQDEILRRIEEVPNGGICF